MDEVFVAAGFNEGNHIHCGLVMKGDFYFDWLDRGNGDDGKYSCLLLHEGSREGAPCVGVSAMCHPGDAREIFEGWFDREGKFGENFVMQAIAMIRDQDPALLRGMVQVINADLQLRSVYSPKKTVASLAQGEEITNCVLFTARLAASLGQGQGLMKMMMRVASEWGLPDEWSGVIDQLGDMLDARCQYRGGDIQQADDPTVGGAAWNNLGTVGGGQVNGSTLFEYGGIRGYSKKECIERCLELNPKNADAWYNLGYVGGGRVNGRDYSQTACYDLQRLAMVLLKLCCSTAPNRQSIFSRRCLRLARLLPLHCS